MSKELIVSVNGREKKIAIVEDDLVTEFYVERGDENQGIVGNIYKGRVMKVLPGMQSAFVDIGLERDSFLYVSDFFDSDEFEGAFEDRKEQPQPQLQPQAQARPQPQRVAERPRPQREAPPEPVEAVSESDEELHMVALRHIEEISEEPVIEPAEDDLAAMETDADGRREPGAAADADPRRRRQRRLRYNAPEEVPGQPAEKEVIAELEPEVEEEPSGRRRRRPRRKRSDDAPEIGAVTASDEELPRPVPDYLIEPEPIWIVQREPLERISDDDGETDEGEMLKDAILQERITERIHAEEYRTSFLELEPTPEVHVGSLRHEFSSDFERISDDASDPEEYVAHVASKRESLLEELLNPTVDESPEEVTASSSSAPESAEIDPDSEEAPLDDASAELRARPPLEEFATRRGGRGRRRGNFRRPAVSDATGKTEEEGEPNEDAEAPAAVAAHAVHAAPASPLARQSNERFARPVISDLLREGQEILVQIAKEPIGQKGARITSHIALPGRYVV